MVQITYPHIKVYLTMQTCGVSLESIQSDGHQSGKDGETVNNASNLSEPSSVTPDSESHPQANVATESIMAINEVVPSEPVNVCQVQEFPTSKRLKVSDTEEVKIIKLKATESSVVEWLQNLDEGVSENLFIFQIKSFMISVYILCFVVIYV